MERNKLPKEVQDKIADLNKAIFRQEADNAAEIYQTILRHDPEFLLREPVQFDLAKLLEEGRQHELALAAYRLLIQYQPMHKSIGHALKSAGMIAFKLKQHDMCVDFLHSFLEQQPSKTDRVEAEDILSRLPANAKEKARIVSSKDDIRVDNVRISTAEQPAYNEPKNEAKKEKSGSISLEWQVQKTPTPLKRNAVMPPPDPLGEIPSIDIWAEKKPNTPSAEEIRRDMGKKPRERLQPPQELILGADLPPTPPARPAGFPQQPPQPPIPNFAPQQQPPPYPYPGAMPPPQGYYPGYMPPPPGYYAPPGFMITPIPGSYPPGYYQPGQIPPPQPGGPSSGAYPLPPPQQQAPAPPVPLEVKPAVEAKASGPAEKDAKQFPPAHAVKVSKRYAPPENESPEARYQRLRDAQFALILPLGKRIHLDSVSEFVARKEQIEISVAKKKVLRRKGLLYDELTLPEVLEMTPLTAECKQSLMFVCVPRELRPYEHFEVFSGEAREQGLKLNIGTTVKRMRWDDIQLINCGRIGSDSFATILGSEPMKEYRFSIKAFEFASLLPTCMGEELPVLYEFVDLIARRAPDAVISHTAQAMLRERVGVPQPFGNAEEFRSYTLWMLFSHRAEIINAKELTQLSHTMSNW